MEENYYEVSGVSSCGRYVIVFPAQNEDEAVRLFAKAKPFAHSITEVSKASKSQYETQENNKREAASRNEKRTHWNQILKQEKAANAN